MTKSPMQSGEFKFSVDSSLLFQLGEQLVAKPSIALAELVKNAYDADATKVTVTLENVGKPGGTIIIEDDGHGMTFEEMQNNWMRIATTVKRENPVSKIYCRPLTGAKGIGRFAARRLGNKLTIQSIASIDENTKECVIANFDWESSFLPGEDLVEIPVSYTRQEVALDIETGVSLFIEGVRDAWTEDEIVNLRRDLLSLQSPFPDLIVKPVHLETVGCLPDPGFNFELVVEGAEDTDDLRKLSGGLAEAFFLEAALARLDGTVDENGRAHYHIEIIRTKEEDKLIDTSNEYSGLENAQVRIYFIVDSAEYFAETDFGVREAQKKGREGGGVRIYLDGFRVFPYGDQGDDWLRLDEYAAKNIDMATAIAPPEKLMELASSIPGRPYLLIPKNQQLFGVVAISQTEHSNVELTVSRERLIETPTVVRLRRFVQNGIYWMTLKYAAFTAEQRAARRKEKTQTVPEIIEEAKAAIATLAGIPEKKRRSIIYNLDKAIEQAKEEEEDRISEISMLRVLASAGTTLTLMNHQLQALIGAVLQTEQDLLRLRPQIPKKLHIQYDDITAQVSEWREMVELQVSQLGFLLASDSRQRRRRHALYEIVEDVRKPMYYYMKKYGVKFENKVPPSLRTPLIYKSELYAVLINILSNALKAIYGQPERKINVEAEKSNNTLYVRMMDTGVGVPVERREISFKPFVTTSVPNPVLGVGTGLGLKVVRDVLEMYGGTARFVDVTEPWKTCIEIVLPERGAEDGD
jgi:signal transduction histidine kinase